MAAYSESVTREVDYIYSPEGLAAIAVKTGSSRTVYYAHTDHLGSLRALTDAGKNIVSRYRYDAWGVRTLVAGTDITARGFTMHEHLPEFGLINMNARLYDPALGRFLSPDPFVQMPDFSQSYNRYSYVLNNPLIYTDPDGEWGWLAAGLGFVYGYVSYGLTHGDWGWKAAGNGALTGLMWGIGYTGDVAGAGISQLAYAGQSAITSTVNSFMPSQSVPITDNFSINTSFGFGISPSGLVAGVNLSGTYHNGDFALTGGISASGNMSSWSVGASYNDIGASYYRTTYGNAIGPDGKPNNQTVGGVGINIKDFSLRVENDVRIKGIGGDGLDRWRSNAVEIGYKNFVIGTTVYTNAPDRENPKYDEGYSRVWNRTKRAYADGTVYSSPLYLGVKHGGGVTRMGIDNPLIQDIFQNGWHIYGSKESPLFPTPYGQWNYAYRYSGYYNPYSLYYR